MKEGRREAPLFHWGVGVLMSVRGCLRIGENRLTTESLALFWGSERRSETVVYFDICPAARLSCQQRNPPSRSPRNR
jgi:hypothetical protein